MWIKRNFQNIIDDIKALPILNSPNAGHLIENMAISEVSKFFTNIGERPKLFFVRSKEKIEIDLLIQFPNHRFIAAEIKITPVDWTEAQHKLIDSSKLNIVSRWIISPSPSPDFKNVQVVEFTKLVEKILETY